MWRAVSEQLTSKGQTTAKATSLADLHRRRSETEGQFYTPDWIALAIGALLRPLLPSRQISVVDTSVGSARLLGWLTPEMASLAGCDIDARCIEAVSADAAAAGFAYTFLCEPLETITAERFDLAIINPAFGLTLGSPLMEPLPCTTYGRYGPNSSALSHLYALEHALQAAAVVVAIMPQSAWPACEAHERCVARYELPVSAFNTEGAHIKTAVFFFAAAERTQQEVITIHSVDPGAEWPALPTSMAFTTKRHGSPIFKSRSLTPCEQVISLPVTGDRGVVLHHHQRRVVLHFACGVTQARVMNRLYGGFVPRPGRRVHRYPAGVRYTGEGALLLDAHLIQDDPERSFSELLERIRSAGGEPTVSPTLAGYWRRLLRERAVMLQPLGRTVLQKGSDRLTIQVQKFGFLRQGDFASPTIRPGDVLTAIPCNGAYSITVGNKTVTMRRDEIFKQFADVSESQGGHQWVDIYPAKTSAARDHWLRRIDALGIHLAPFQREDLAEVMAQPTGAMLGWEMGLGKARGAIVMALLRGNHNLIIVEAGLIPEMKRELAKLNVNPQLWQHIERPEQLDDLRQLNLISDHRLRMVLPGRISKTYAAALRRRIDTAIFDEGSCLASPRTAITGAVRALSPRRLLILDGTLIPNYPRDMLELAQIVYGGGRYYQPFDVYGLHLTPATATSLSFAERGVDAFSRLHVVYDWATNEFKDTLREGAKREIPVINNVAAFREWLAPLMKRRVRNEPACAPLAGYPDPVITDVHLPWDKGHLRYYLTVVHQFEQWYRQHKEDADRNGKQINLLLVVAKINACRLASSAPMMPSSLAMGTYNKLTQKQRYALDRLEENAERGIKSILYAENPAVLALLHRELAARNVPSLVFDGTTNIRTRTAELDEKFRFGPVNVLLASTGVTQRGLNLEQAKYVLLYDRCWCSSTEAQLIARVTRIGQTIAVPVERLHHEGSIDTYVGQLADFKATASAAGLDYGDGMGKTEEFRHYNDLFERFIEGAYGLSSSKLLETLGTAA